MSEGNPLAKGAAWMNGEIMPINEARLPVNDWGILHSDITYDVVPVRDGAFFRLPDYMGRFRASRASWLVTRGNVPYSQEGGRRRRP